ncbi:MAG: bifunctional nuclease family protein [Capsulimonadaceae bacterium]|nr:bifunctional nuclease family protein [Capsulimonadaceae bacterium]
MSSDFKDLFGEDWRPHDTNDDPQSSGEPITPSDSGKGGAEFTSETENQGPRALNEKEVKVSGVYLQQEPGMPAQHFVLLRDNRGRRVPIWVGPFEAWAISFAIEEQPADRPLTHDLMKILLEKLNATVDRIIIDDLWRDTFYAKITVVTPDGNYLEIDARPSDAIALALRVHAPIYMAEYVLEQTVHKE